VARCSATGSKGGRPTAHRVILWERCVQQPSPDRRIEEAVPSTIDDVKRHGRHYTPSVLAEFLADRASGALDIQKRSVRVLDPACGDGELLLAAARSLANRGWQHVELVGFDLDAEAVSTAERRLTSAGLCFRLGRVS